MKITNSNILHALNYDRRKFLKSAGAIALLNCFWNQIEQIASADAANRKVLFLFFPHGSPQEAEFFPTPGALDADLKGVLAPLNAFKSKMTVLGKMGGAMLSDYGHNGGNNATLTGAGQRGSGGGGVPYTPGAPSIDWLIAKALGQSPLVLGANANTGARHCISWSSADAAGMTPCEKSPIKAFTGVYGMTPTGMNCAPLAQAPTQNSGQNPAQNPTQNPETPKPFFSAEASILDVVAKDIVQMKSALPSWSRTVFDEQLQTIRDLEVQAKAPKLNLQSFQLEGTADCATEPTGFDAIADRHAELLATVLQGGKRRVGVLQYGASSGDSFTVPGFGGYHKEVHDLSNGKQGDRARVASMQLKIFERIGALIGKLDSTSDVSGGSLLDNTLVYICTEFGVYGEGADPHNTGGDFAVTLVGGANVLQTPGISKAESASYGNLLVSVTQFMGTPQQIKKHTGLSGVFKGV